MYCPPFSSAQLELVLGLSSHGPLDAVFVVPFSLHEDVSVDLSLLPMKQKREQCTGQGKFHVVYTDHSLIFHNLLS